MTNNTLTTRQAAEKLNVSARRVRQFIKDGRLTATKTGRDWLVDSGSVDSLVKVPRRAGRPRLVQPEGVEPETFPPNPGEVIEHLRKG